MSKPYGMTDSFQIVTPSRTEDKVWDAVEEAIAAGWTPTQMMAEVRDCWKECTRRKSSDDDKEFSRMKP